jgi:glucan endo-1,3-beta-D-glucosidase
LCHSYDQEILDQGSAPRFGGQIDGTAYRAKLCQVVPSGIPFPEQPLNGIYGFDLRCPWQITATRVSIDQKPVFIFIHDASKYRGSLHEYAQYCLYISQSHLEVSRLEHSFTPSRTGTNLVSPQGQRRLPRILQATIIIITGGSTISSLELQFNKTSGDTSCKLTFSGFIPFSDALKIFDGQTSFTMLLRLSSLTFAFTACALAQSQQQGILGFNSGNTLDNKKAKEQTDFEAEFKAAQALHYSPGLFNSVRLYTCVQAETTDTPISAFPAAIATNTTLLLGIWCSGTNDISPEVKALKSAISQYGQKFVDLVVGISVGSEDMYRVSESGISNKAGVGQGPDQMLTFIKSVRDAIAGTPLADKPVGHVDTWSAWANSSNSAVLQEVDFVGTDLYPYYEKDKGNDYSNMTEVYDYIYGLVNSAASNASKPIWITETGWPASGPDFGQAKASVDNAKGYWDTIGCGKLFGRTNVWWYNLRDSNPDNQEKFAITKDLSSTPLFNLSCPADSGAPATINQVTSDSTRIGTSRTILAFMLGLFVATSLFV